MEASRPPSPPSRSVPAPPLAQHTPAAAPPPTAAAPPKSQQPVVQSAQTERLTIAPQASPGNAPSIEFDWEPMGLGTNRSYACTVTTEDGQGLSVSLAQGLYRRTFDGREVVRVAAIPVAVSGTQGTLTARNLVTGASATFTWQWQPGSNAAPLSSVPRKSSGLLGRLFGRTKSAPAAASIQARPAVRVATTAERLGERAALAVSLKFFGQEAIGQRFAFILDRSGSMEGARWTSCRRQFERALRAMPEHADFAVVLFSHVDLEPPGQSEWTRADRPRVEDVITWIGRIRPRGGTRPTTAFQRVFSLASPPDVIYFLTDGDLEGFDASALARIRGTATTVVNTIALENGESADALREIAAASGGQFMLVPDASVDTHE